MTKATSTATAEETVKAPKVLKDPEVKKLEKNVYTTGYWDAVRGVRAIFGEKSEIVGIYDKGFAAGKKALEDGKVSWTPKRAPKQRVGYEPTAATIAAEAAQVALDGVTADPEAQARVLEEATEAPLSEEADAATEEALGNPLDKLAELDPGDDDDENGDEQDDAVVEPALVAAAV